MNHIKHIWFDFSDTMAFLNKEAHDNLRYETYASVINKGVTPELISEYEALYQKNNKSNAAIFRSLGKSAGYWSSVVNQVDPNKLYKLADANIPFILKEIKNIVPISIFSNIELERILPALGIDLSLFTHILSSAQLKEPKPALEGFYKVIELSHLPGVEILYIGDDVGKDVLPAKKVGLKTGLMWAISDQADYSFESFKDVLEMTKILL